MQQSRIFAISDLHVDYKANLKFINSLPSIKYNRHTDVLIVAGDVTDNLSLLEATLKSLKSKFKEVFYVSGNHELWLRSKDPGCSDSITKFHKIQSLCKKIGVHSSPKEISVSFEESVWIVPLYSWYSKPEIDADDSLYRTPPPHVKQDVKFSEHIWMDNHLCDWSKLPAGQTQSMYFSALNESALSMSYGDKPIISFSHFLPRWDLIPGTETDMAMVEKERTILGVEGEMPKFQGGVKGFNFARYAGSKTLERQIRQLGSVVHVYGHQHRNRDRIIDGVRYVSHCLGKPKEQENGWVWGMAEWKGPKQIWPQQHSDAPV